MQKGYAVVDGSNIATEGRTTPSLAQLDEAVTTFIEENDFEHVTVIVDATFEHRVEKHERDAARAAIDDGEVITPPAGVIGRGDAFILQIADRANAVVLSNDSFQEFHGTYDWLFDDGRLIGGKPIPGVGWIYVPRSPVRGPVSRRAVRESTVVERAPANPKVGDARRVKKTASKRPPTKRSTSAKKAAAKPTRPPKKSVGPETQSAPPKKKTASSRKAKTDSNTRAAWKRFRDDYPEGSTVAAIIERFSSHGAYGSVDNVTVYMPLRLLGNPAPRRARDAVTLGDTGDFVVHGFDESRLGIDVGLTKFVAASGSGRTKATGPTPAKTRKPARSDAVKKTASKKTPSKTVAVKRSAAKKPVVKKPVTKKAAAKRSVAKKPAAKKPVTKKAAAKRSVAKKATPKKAKAKKKTRAKQTGANTKAVPKKAVPKKPAAKRAPAKKTSAKRPPTKKTAAKKPAKTRS